MDPYIHNQAAYGAQSNDPITIHGPIHTQSGGLWRPGEKSDDGDKGKVDGTKTAATAPVTVGDGGLSWKARQLKRLQERAEAEVCMCVCACVCVCVFVLWEQRLRVFF